MATSDEKRRRKQEKLKAIVQTTENAIDPVFLLASIGLLLWGLGLALIAWKTDSIKLALAQLGCSIGGTYQLQKRKTGVKRVLDEAEDLLEVDTEEELDKEVDEMLNAWLTHGVDSGMVFCLTLTAPVWIAIPTFVSSVIGIKLWVVNTVFVILLSPVAALCIAFYERIRNWIVARVSAIATPVVSKILEEVEEHIPLL